MPLSLNRGRSHKFLQLMTTWEGRDRWGMRKTLLTELTPLLGIRRPVLKIPVHDLSNIICGLNRWIVDLCTGTFGMMCCVMQQVVTSLQEIKQTQMLHSTMLQSLSRKLNATNAVASAQIPSGLSFPIRTLEELAKTEDMLTDAANKQIMVSIVSLYLKLYYENIDCSAIKIYCWVFAGISKLRIGHLRLVLLLIV